MPRVFERVTYESLNARQKESYNFQKISAVLAEFGFVTIRLSDDWKGADFLAQHNEGGTLKVQLKSRLTFQKKYQGNKTLQGAAHKLRKSRGRSLCAAPKLGR